ncbi:hypothetical protein C8J56DRAFT_893429 [Mycena floridula]|nr:hypothetical protein C8J56DRAFT_893429 [Mycena floridula]
MPSDNSALFAFAAGADSSPLRPSVSTTSNKHQRDSSDDDDEFNTGETAPRNQTALIAAATKYGAKKRLRSDQQMELNTFVMDTTTVQNMKLFAALMAVEGSLGKVIQAMPVFSVSEDLKKNIISIAGSVLLSSHISAYKAGKTAQNHVMAMLKRHRYGLPPNIENVTADWEKVKAVAGYALTEKRSSIKKLLRKSLTGSNGNTNKCLPGPEQATIYQLTKSLVEDTKTPVTPALAARVALMRRVYILDPSNGFWDKLDEDLEDIQKEATRRSLESKKPFARCLVKIFDAIIQADKSKHGVSADEDLNGDSNDDTFQDDVDAIINHQSLKVVAGAGADDQGPSASAEAPVTGPTED